MNKKYRYRLITTVRIKGYKKELMICSDIDTDREIKNDKDVYDICDSIVLKELDSRKIKRDKLIDYQTACMKRG